MVKTHGILIAILMLVVWTIGILTAEMPGWFHILLTAGVFLLIWAIVLRGTPPPRSDHR